MTGGQPQRRAVEAGSRGRHRVEGGRCQGTAARYGLMLLKTGDLLRLGLLLLLLCLLLLRVGRRVDLAQQTEHLAVRGRQIHPH